MVRDWGQMPYPKFLETSRAELACGDEVLWSGMCYFAYRARAVVEKDGVKQNVNARATMEADLTEFAAQVSRPAACLKVWHGGALKSFGIVEVTPAYNPDGSFHHISFSLLEGAIGDEGDAV